MHLQFRREANERIGTVAADCFNGVADEVVENLTQLIGVASNFGKIAVAVQLNFGACTVVEVDDFGKEKLQIQRLENSFGKLGEIAEVVDHLLHGVYLRDDGAGGAVQQRLVLFVEFAGEFHLETLGRQTNRREWVLDFMG